MTLEQDGDIVRMVECPFCDADLRDEPPAEHLKQCEEFQQSADIGSPGCIRDRRTDSRIAAADTLSDSNGGDT